MLKWCIQIEDLNILGFEDTYLHECLVAKLCPTLCDAIDCSLPGSSVRGILQAKILEWVAILFSRRPSWTWVWTQVFCTAGGFFTIWVTREPFKGIFTRFPIPPPHPQHTRVLAVLGSTWHCQTFKYCQSGKYVGNI